MTFNSIEALGAVLDIRSESNNSTKKTFGFYWTRKNPDLAQKIIETFTKTKSVVLDPFMGSGTTGLGCLAAKGERLFVGVEINELPIANFLFTLQPAEYITDKELEKVKKSLQNIRQLYEFEVNGDTCEITKIVHEKKNNKLEPVIFTVQNKSGIEFEISDKDGNFFAEFLHKYKQKINAFPIREQHELNHNSRIAIKSGMRISDVFGPIGFEAMCVLKEAAVDTTLLKLLIGSILHLVRLTDAKSQSQFPFWYPNQNIHEKAIPQLLEKKFKEMLKMSPRMLDTPPEVIKNFVDWKRESNSSVMVIKGSIADDLSCIPTGSVDFVLTDPPYFDQVAFSEYLKLWEYFTDYKSDLEREIVQSGRTNGNKTRANFLIDLEKAFTEVRRVLRDKSLAIIYFKDSKPTNLHDFITVLGRAGFKYVGQRHLAKKSHTYKQNSTLETTVGGDALMIFEASLDEFIEPQPTESIEKLDQVFLCEFAKYYENYGPCSLTEAMDNALIKELYKTGYLSKIKDSKHLVGLLKNNYTFDPTTRKWHLNDKN